MPTIPTFRTRGVSQRVPQGNIASGNESAMGTELQNLGIKGTKFFSELAAKRKALDDSSDASSKLLDYQRAWFNENKKLISARLEDGSMDPERGFEVDERLQNQKYGDVVNSKSEEILESMAGSTRSSESEAMFRKSAMALRNKWVVDADGKTNELNTKSKVTKLQSDAESFSRDILSQPILDEDYVIDIYKNLEKRYNELFFNEAIDETAHKTLIKGVANTITVSSLNNWMAHKQPKKVLSFLQSGGLVDKPEEYEEEKSLDETIQAFDNLGVEDKSLIKFYKEAQKQGILEETEVSPINKLSLSLSKEQANAYYKAAMKLLDKKGGGNISLYKENIRDFKDMGEKGTIFEKENWKEIAQDIKDQTIDIYQKDSPTLATRLTKDVALPLLTNNYIKSIPMATPEERDLQRKNLKGLDEQLLDQAIKEVPELDSYRKDLMKSPTIRNLSGNLIEAHKRADIAFREELAKDTAGYFVKYEGETGTAFREGDIPRYLRALNYQQNRFKIREVDRSKVPDEVIENFATAYNNSDASERVELLQNEKARWGSNWVNVIPEYVKDDRIPYEVRIASTFTDENAMAHMLSVLDKENEDKINSNFQAKFSKYSVALKSRLADDDYLDNFYKAIRYSYTFAGQADNVIDTFGRAIDLMAKENISKGRDVKESVKMAVKQIAEGNFGVVEHDKSPVFFHKSSDARADKIEAFVDNVRTEEDFARFGKIIPGKSIDNVPLSIITEVKARQKEFGGKISVSQAYNKFLEDNSQWVTSRDGTGLTLIAFDKNQNIFTPILSKTNKPIKVTWKEINDSRTVRQALKPLFGGR